MKTVQLSVGNTVLVKPKQRVFTLNGTPIELSASYNLPAMEDYNLVLTFDTYNLTNAPISTYIEEESQTFRAYFLGATYSFGIRGSF